MEALQLPADSAVVRRAHTIRNKDDGPVELPTSWFAAELADAVAYVFADREDRDSDHTLGAIDTIPVPATDWTDVVKVRAVAA